MLKTIISLVLFVNLFVANILFAKVDEGILKEEAGSSSLPQLDYTKFLQEMFWFIILFVCLYFFVKNVFFVKIYSIKSLRNERISMYLSKISKIKKEIDIINKKINLSLEKSNKKADEIIKNSIENVSKNTKDKIMKNLESEKTKKKNMNTELLQIKEAIYSNSDKEILEISRDILNAINISFLDEDIKQAIQNVNNEIDKL